MNVYEIRRPAPLATLPYWPDDAAEVVEAAIYGARGGAVAIACFWRFPDGSDITLEYQLDRRPEADARVYETAGEPPLLSIVVDDHGAGVKVVCGGMSRRVAANDAEKALADIQKHLGKDKPMAMYGQIMATSRRQYWVKVEA